MSKAKAALSQVPIPIWVFLLFSVSAFLYTTHLGAENLVLDDEGWNLYPAWRVSRGEILYKDVPFSHTPLSVHLTAAVFSLTGPSVQAAKALTVCFALLAGVFLFMLAAPFIGPWRCLLALGLLFSDYYWCWFSLFNTPDVYYLAFYMASAWLFMQGFREGRPDDLIFSGLFAGLAIFSKLFGVFAIGGSLLFLGVRRYLSKAHPDEPPQRDLGRLVLFMIGLLPTVGFFLYSMSGYIGAFIRQTILHHNQVYVELSPLLVFYAFVNKGWMQESPLGHRLIVLLGVGAAWASVFAADLRQKPLRLFCLCHLAQALIFLVLGHEFYARHLLFTLPFLSILLADILGELATQAPLVRSFVGFVVGLILVSNILFLPNHLPPYAGWKIVEWIQTHTRGDASILCEYGEVAFLAQRRICPLPVVPASGNRPDLGIYRLTGEDLIMAMGADPPEAVLIRQEAGPSEDLHFLGQIAGEQELLAYLERNFDRVQAPGLEDWLLYLARD